MRNVTFNMKPRLYLFTRLHSAPFLVPVCVAILSLRRLATDENAAPPQGSRSRTAPLRQRRTLQQRFVNPRAAIGHP